MVGTSSVLKKISPNGKLTIYLRTRDYASIIEPIDGIIDIHTSYLKHRKIFGQLIAHFRYGREKDEIMGLKFHKEFCLSSTQIFPAYYETQSLTETQMALTEKLSTQNVFPFTFYFPNAAPTSVSLESKESNEHTKACGIHYYVRVFVADKETDAPHRRNSTKLNIRRIQYVPPDIMNNPSYSIVRHNFAICKGDIELEVSLDKRVYESEEEMPVNITVQNGSNKIVKKILVTLFQNVSIQMLQAGQYKRIVDEYITWNGCPLQPGSSYQTVVSVKPSMIGNYGKDGLALDGHHKREKYDLASSTFAHNEPVKDAFGIIVNYFIRVKLDLGKVHGNVIAILPFILMPRDPREKQKQIG